MNWLIFSLMTALCFGLYGIFLHSGQISMKDPSLGRYKAFLFVGVAYFVIAVLVPLILLKVQGAMLNFPAKGMGLSFIAGLLGAVGAFCILLAFGAKGTPAGFFEPSPAKRRRIRYPLAVCSGDPLGGVGWLLGYHV